MYKVCQKSNGTGVTNNLFQFQTINYKVFPPLSLMHFPILLCYASRYCWKDSSGMSLDSHYSSVDGFHAFKTGALDDLLDPGEKNKVTLSKIRWIGRCVPVWWCSSRPRSVEFKVKHPTITSCTLSKVDAARSPCRLTNWSSGSWQKFAVDDALYIEECDKHGWLFVLLSSALAISRDFHWLLWHLVSRLYSKIHVSSQVMTLWSKSGSVWRWLMISCHTCMWCSLSLSSLGTDFAQIFCMSKSSKHCPFACLADLWSFKQLTNDCHTLPTLPTQHWPQSCLLKASCSGSHLLPSQVSKACVWHGVISIHLVTWSLTERREIRNFPYSSVFELTGLNDWPLKGGIRNVGQLLGLPVEGSKECKSSYLYSVTSPGWIEKEDRGPNELPERVRKEKEAEWLARTLKTEVAFSSAEIGIKNSVLRTEVAVRGRVIWCHNSGRRSRAEFLGQ